VLRVIGHHPDIECIRVVVICKFDHSVNPLLGAPSVRDIDGYPPRQRFRGKVGVSVCRYVCSDCQYVRPAPGRTGGRVALIASEDFA